MRKLAAAIATAIILTAAPAIASEPCLQLPTGECLTAEMYDEWFGFDNLSQVPLLGPIDMSVAEAYDIQPDNPVAPSERPRVFEGVTYPSFSESLLTIARPTGR